MVRRSDADTCLLVGAGVTLHECLQAADVLGAEGIHARVFDPFTVKPLDAAALIENARACGGRVVTVEDHYPEGRLFRCQFCGLFIFVNSVKSIIQCRLFSIQFLDLLV